MSFEIKPLSKSDKIKYAEKHLGKFILELKRHFGFSDFQIIKLLEGTSKKFKKDHSIVSKLKSAINKKL